MSQPVRFAIAAAVLASLGSLSQTVLANCSCRAPFEQWAITSNKIVWETTPFFADHWQAAREKWNQYFQSAQSDVRIYGENSGTGVPWRIMLDSSVNGWPQTYANQNQTEGYILIHPDLLTQSATFIKRTISHELGELLGFGHGNCSQQDSVMTVVQPSQLAANAAVLPGCAEENTVKDKYVPAPSEEAPPPEECGGGCECDDCSPIMILLDPGGLRLSSVEAGVYFDISARGVRGLVAWPVDGTSAFLALDRNANGRIDDGSELFGNSTRLMSGAWASHGYEALREFDSNGDGRITATDPIYWYLLLWSDAQRNGTCAATELITVESAGITEISLDARESRRHDEWGNEFRFRSLVRALTPPNVRYSYDVFLRVIYQNR